MRGKPHLVAIFSDNGILRAQTLRFQEEMRDPESVGLSPAEEPSAAALKRMTRAVESLADEELPLDQMVDEDAERLEALVESKADAGQAIGRLKRREMEKAEIVDLIDVLKARMGESA
jgi:DNA end-binding protein Ku